ncbi:hypothetical protein [Paraburkholderia sp. J76]|uniref:hypothetical protein n=1 Tax=Paraburkholderia sp. J76 TaxID=2805439 RepID=UPI002ABDF285|nr:hypothetical protein [Paraburkholderia sp. J76]
MSDDETILAGDMASRDLNDLDLEILQSSDQYPQAIKVEANTLAIEAVSQALASNASLVVVVDTRNEVYGVVDLPWMFRGIDAAAQKNFDSPGEALLAMIQDDSGFWKNFPRDSLTGHRPELHRCRGGHYTTDNPCPIHEKG